MEWLYVLILFVALAVSENPEGESDFRLALCTCMSVLPHPSNWDHSFFLKNHQGAEKFFESV